MLKMKYNADYECYIKAIWSSHLAVLGGVQIWVYRTSNRVANDSLYQSIVFSLHFPLLEDKILQPNDLKKVFILPESSCLYSSCKKCHKFVIFFFLSLLLYIILCYVDVFWCCFYQGIYHETCLMKSVVSHVSYLQHNRDDGSEL